MQEDIIDDYFIEKPKQSRLKWVGYASLVILCLGLFLCFRNGLLGNIKVLIAIVALSVTTGLTFYKPKIGLKVTMVLILLANFGLIRFFPFTVGVGLRIGSFLIGVEFIMMMVACLHIGTNWDEFSAIPDQFTNKEKVQRKREEAAQQKINYFKSRFANKSIAELKVKAGDTSLLPEANRAARELLEEKQS